MEKNFIKFLPIDKSWAIRMGFLDIINNSNHFLAQVDGKEDLNDDIRSLIKASKQWANNSEIDVGESGTLFRYLQFASWKLGLGKTFIKNKTLLERNICDDPNIVDWPLEKLLELDYGTAQWASAAILLGNTDSIPAGNYFLKMSEEVLKCYREGNYEVRIDKTFLGQIETFFEILEGKNPDFKMRHPDDYCFARAFNMTTKEEGKKSWPALEGHESNRPEEMEIALEQYSKSETITSKDHRVVQSIKLLSMSENKDVDFENPDCVNKSWPQFWEFADSDW